MDESQRHVAQVLQHSTGMKRQQARAAVLHRRKFMDGKMSPEEAHQRYGIPPHARCACGARPLITCRIFMPLDEVVKRQGTFVGLMLAGKEEELYSMLLETIHGTFVRVSTAYACKQHEKDLDLAAAKAPSWCLVEFNRGPGAEKIVIGGNNVDHLFTSAPLKVGG